ncbi:MAG: hypothetical protein ACTSU4_00485 [Promethearchaeota archaeon]
MTSSTEKKGKGTNWKKEILEFLNKNPSGYTITDIAKGIKSTRITVSKYLSLLKNEKKVISKDIGVYKLYFSKDRKFIDLGLVRSFYKAFLSGIKSKITRVQEYKELGHFISDSMFKYIIEVYPESLRKQITSFKDFLQFFSKMYPYHDFLYTNDLIIEENLDLANEKGVYKLSNVEILDISDNFKLHFYILSGIFEHTLSKIFRRKPIVCNIEKIDKKKKEVVISLQRK